MSSQILASPTRERLTPDQVEHPQVGLITVWRVNNRVGECPVWISQEEALYWIDVRAQQLLKLVPDSQKLTRWHLPEVVGAMALTDTGDVWLAFPHQLVSLNLDSGVLTHLTSVETEQPNNRLNDGKASPTGRWFVFGSMDDRASKCATGALYRASPAGEVQCLIKGLTVANGIAWSVDASQIFFSDSHTGKVYAASWDENSGAMGSPNLFVKLDELAGRPDGAAVDAENCYWSAGVSAGVLHRIDSRGQVVQRITLPCRAPTMCTFGGQDNRTVFVTSLVRPQWDSPGSMEGALLSFRCETQGALASRLSVRGGTPRKSAAACDRDDSSCALPDTELPTQGRNTTEGSALNTTAAAAMAAAPRAKR